MNHCSFFMLKLKCFFLMCLIIILSVIIGLHAVNFSQRKHHFSILELLECSDEDNLCNNYWVSLLLLVMCIVNILYSFLLLFEHINSFYKKKMDHTHGNLRFKIAENQHQQHTYIYKKHHILCQNDHNQHDDDDDDNDHQDSTTSITKSTVSFND